MEALQADAERRLIRDAQQQVYWYWIKNAGYAVGLLVLYLVIRTFRNWPKLWKSDKDGDFQATFLNRVNAEQHWNIAFQETLTAIVSAWAEQGCGGVILVEKNPIKGKPPNKYQMIDFYGPSKFRQLPMIEIQWAWASTLPQAKTFLKDEKVEIIECTEDTFRAMFQHIARYCNTDERIDAAARCKIYEGYLSPAYSWGRR